MKKAAPFALILLMLISILAGCRKSEVVIASLDDAGHARIGVMTGSTGEAITRARFPEAQVKSFDDIMDAVAAMKSGQLDAIVTGFPAALQVSKKNTDLGLLSEPLTHEDTAIALKKGNEALLAALNKIIAELKRDGTLESMKERWFKPDLSPYEELNIVLPTEGKPLKIGVSATREPFSFVDKNGRVTGHDGELARIIGARLQRPVEFLNMKFMALIPALQSGKVDLIITGMTATDERRKYVDFTDPYYANAQVMLVRNRAAAMSDTGKSADQGRVMTLRERLDGKRIAVLTGTAADLAARSYFSHADFKASISAADAALAVKTNKADAFVMNKAILQKLVRKNPDLMILEEPIAKVEIAAAIKKGNSALLSDINRVLNELKNEGTLDRLRAKWIDSNYIETPKMVVIEDKEANGVLKMGTSAKSEPLSFICDNTLVGHDIELGRLIAKRLGKRLEIIDMNFESLIPALESGKIDMALSNFNVTEERKKLVSFSTPYLLNDISALVRRYPESVPVADTVKPPVKEGATKRSEAEYASVADLKDKRIAVLGGSAGDLAARRHFPNARFQVFVASTDAALAVKNRKADAFVYDKSVLLNLAKKNPELVIMEQAVDELEIAAAVRLDNAALLTGINGVLTELKKEGVLGQLRAKWIDSKYTVTPQIKTILAAHTKGILRMGTCATIEPFSFLANGKLTGLDIELSRLIGQRLGKNIEIIDMNFQALIPALQAGKIDFALSNFNVTEERRKLIGFSQPYVENDISALVRRSPVSGFAADGAAPVRQGLKLASVADLKDKRIGVLVGSAHDIYATKNYPDATILQYKTPADVALAVKTGKVDAALFDADPLREIMRQDDSLGLVGDPLFTFNVGAGFNKGNPVLLNQFNRFLADIKRNGVYEDMVRRWMEQRDTRMPVIENTRANGVLVVGTSDAGLPFTAVKDNRLVGFDIELCERFAASIGKAIKFANMDFGSLIAAVSSGKVDMVSSSIYVTEERKKQINFSAPYYEMGTRIFALKTNILPASSSALSESGQKKLASIADLKNKRIGVLLGSVHDTYAVEHYPDATILLYKSLPDMVLAVKAGKIDAAIYTRETLLEIVRGDSELGLLGGSLLSYPIGMGFKKGNNVLREQFNAFLKRIKSNGEFEDMETRWLKNATSEMPAITNTGANGVLVVGIVSDKGLPFAVVKDGRLIGFDIELAERFGAYLGKKIDYADMEFGNLIAAVSSGKIDMIDSTLMLTEERKTRIDFSDPYYELGANVFVLKKNIATHEEPSEARPPVMPFLTRVANSFYSNIILEDRYLLIFDGLRTTVIISICATLFGTMLGSLICFMRMSKRRVLNLPARLYINILRGMPVLVLLMLIFYVVFASVDIDPVIVAIIAFGMNFAAYVSEIFRSGIEGIDKGQTEAGIAMGFTRFKTFVFIILPQTLQRILPVYKGEFISLVKMTSIVGYIAVQDLTKASDIIRSRTFDAFFPLIMVAMLYFTISWILMQVLEYLERITDPRYKRKKAGKA